jgi:hypothetical protein
MKTKYSYITYICSLMHVLRSLISRSIAIGCLSSYFGYHCLLLIVILSYLSLLFSADCRVVAITVCC